MSTYSIFTASSYEATKFDNIVDVLTGLPDNSSNLITPRNVRNAVLSAYDNSIFGETKVSTFTASYLGINNSLLRLPILLGKKTLSSTEILDNALLSSDTDIFIYNAKSDTNPSLQNTKMSFLAGSNFNDFDFAPYIKATKISSPSRIDLSIINPATAGIINIGTSASILYLGDYEFPTLNGVNSGNVLQYLGSTLTWSNVITGTAGYIPYYSTSTSLAPSFLRQTTNTVVLKNGVRFSDESGLLELDYRNGQGIVLSSDGQSRATANITVNSTSASLNYGSGSKLIDVASSRIKMRHTDLDASFIGGVTISSNKFSVSSSNFYVGATLSFVSSTHSLFDINTGNTTLFSKSSIANYTKLLLNASYDADNGYFGYQMIMQTGSMELLDSNGQGISMFNNSYITVAAPSYVAFDTDSVRSSNILLTSVGANDGGEYPSLSYFGVVLSSVIANSDPDDDTQASLAINNGVNNSFYIRMTLPNALKYSLTPLGHYFMNEAVPSGLVLTHKTLDTYGTYVTYSNNSYRYMTYDDTTGSRYKNSVFRRSYTHPSNTGQFFTVSHNMNEKYVSVSAYVTNNVTYNGGTGLYSASSSVSPNYLTQSSQVKVIDHNTLWVYLPTSSAYVIVVNS